MAVDPSFNLNELDAVKYYSETETLKNNILTLFFMRPGAYPSLPKLGIDILKYLYDSNVSSSQLEGIIISQCSYLAPYIDNGQLQITKVDNDGYFSLYIILPAVIANVKTKFLLGFKAYQDERMMRLPQYAYDMQVFVESSL